MSWEAARWAWEQKVRPTEKFVLVAIADHCTKGTGTGSYPSLSTLAQKTGLSRRAVSKAVKRLEAMGKIIIRRHKNPAGDYDNNVYEIPLQGSEQDSPRSEQDSPPVGNNIPHGREPRSPRVGNHVPSKSPLLRVPVRERGSAHKKPSLEDFEITESLHPFLEELNISLQTAKYELEKFRDNRKAKGIYPRDVAAAFRNWLRKSKEFSLNGNRSSKGEDRLREHAEVDLSRKIFS